jgi:oxygen-independent coproporphyrinogen-3 oxidase
MSDAATSSVLARTPAEEDVLPDLFGFDQDTRLNTDDYADLLGLRRSAAPAPVAVHVRLPFCPSRCLSCDHHTIVSHGADDIDRYLGALDREMALVTGLTGSRLPLAQLQLGGGTPNYLSETQLVRLMDIIERHFVRSEETVSSLEANPKRCSDSQLALLHGLGFSQIDFQVRDLDRDVQMAIGRSHSQQMLQDVFDGARGHGFETISMDMVYGLPGQTTASVRNTVKGMLSLEPNRIHCLGFSRRPDLFHHQRALDPARLPSLADKLAMFNIACEAFLEEGYVWVGLDVFAHEDDALVAASRENRLGRNWVGYHTHNSDALFGFGTDAVSDLPDARTQNLARLGDWRAAIESGQLPLQSGTRLSSEQRRQQDAFTRLVCNLRTDDYESLLGTLDAPGPLNSLQSDGLVTVVEDELTITESGRFALHQLWGDASPRFRDWQAASYAA